MGYIADICDLVVIKLQLGKAVQALQAVNLRNPSVAEDQAFDLRKRYILLLLSCSIWVSTNDLSRDGVSRFGYMQNHIRMDACVCVHVFVYVCV